MTTIPKIKWQNINWSALVTLVVALAGAVFWLGSMQTRINELEKEGDDRRHLEARIKEWFTAHKLEFKGEKGEPGQKGDKGDSGHMPEEFEKRLQSVIRYANIFEKISSNEEGAAALLRLATPPKEGWAIYGEPCHDTNGYDHQHEQMHNRQFNATSGSSDSRPAVGDIVVAREFVTVWKDGPKYDDRDGYPIYGKEQYPPEKTFGVLVPGQRAKIVRVHPIKFGPTFVEFRLL